MYSILKLNFIIPNPLPSLLWRGTKEGEDMGGGYLSFEKVS